MLSTQDECLPSFMDECRSSLPPHVPVLFGSFSSISKMCRLTFHIGLPEGEQKIKLFLSFVIWVLRNPTHKIRSKMCFWLCTATGSLPTTLAYYDSRCPIFQHQCKTIQTDFTWQNTHLPSTCLRAVFIFSSYCLYFSVLTYTWTTDPSFQTVCTNSSQYFALITFFFVSYSQEKTCFMFQNILFCSAFNTCQTNFKGTCLLHMNRYRRRHEIR